MERDRGIFERDDDRGEKGERQNPMKPRGRVRKEIVFIRAYTCIEANHSRNRNSRLLEETTLENV